MKLNKLLSIIRSLNYYKPASLKRNNINKRLAIWMRLESNSSVVRPFQTNMAIGLVNSFQHES